MRFVVKILLIYVFFVCLIVNTYGQAEQTRLFSDYFAINENARKIKDAKIKNMMQVLTVGKKTDTVLIADYESSGNLLRQIRRTDTTAAGEFDYVITNYSFIYKDNILVEKIDSSSENVKRFYIEYDDAGNISKEEVKLSGKVIMKIDYEYDNLSRLIESTAKDVINGCKITETYSYDSYNNLAKKSVKDECASKDNKPVAITYNYKYDSKYRIIEKKSIFPNAGYKVLSFKYGPNGEVTESYISEGSDSYENEVYTYDEKNNSVKIESSEVIGELTKKSYKEIQNDKFGNLITLKYLDANGLVLRTVKNYYQYY